MYGIIWMNPFLSSVGYQRTDGAVAVRDQAGRAVGIKKYGYS